MKDLKKLQDDPEMKALIDQITDALITGAPHTKDLIAKMKDDIKAKRPDLEDNQQPFMIAMLVCPECHQAYDAYSLHPIDGIMKRDPGFLEIRHQKAYTIMRIVECPHCHQRIPAFSESIYGEEKALERLEQMRNPPTPE